MISTFLLESMYRLLLFGHFAVKVLECDHMGNIFRMNY